MSECAVCGDIGPYPVFIETSTGYEMEHRCADHLPASDDGGDTDG